MKIDYKNYPALEALEKRDFTLLSVFSDDIEEIKIDLPNHIIEWKKNIKAFQKEIVVITKPFYKACMDSKEILRKLIDETMNVEPIQISGTYILLNHVIMINIEQAFDLLNGTIYMFNQNGYILASYVFTGNKTGLGWLSKCSESDYSTDDVLNILTSNLSAITLFRKYATVETKLLRPHQRPREISCLYRNNTKSNVLFLDCKWFTNLVKSDGFNVRGHFRLQPKKLKGEWTKELIWINEFHKTGYTAPARMLSQNKVEALN